MRTIKYWIDPNGSMRDLTPAQTQARFQSGLDEISEFAKVEFIRINKTSGTRFNITFLHQNDMYLGALGSAKGRSIKINNSRSVGLKNNPAKRTPESLIQHEYMHLEGFGHVDDKSCIMHPWLTSIYFCPSEVERFRKKFGSTNKIFYPRDKMLRGDMIRSSQAKITSLTAERERLLALRDGSTDVKFRQDTQKKVLANLEELRDEHQVISEHVKIWWELKRRWNNTPYAG